MSLTVLIVGAGIAGLSSAVALRRAGHKVIIFERSSMNNEVGAAINVPPNASRFLARWGLNPEEEGFVKAKCVDFVDPFTMKTVMRHVHDRMEELYGGASLWFAHRVDLHDSLKKMALAEKGPGIKVEVRLKTEVVAYVSWKSRPR
jgi:salicylate hydroxylase